jgi:uncharacterized protein YjbJ (UPF0337 family)
MAGSKTQAKGKATKAAGTVKKTVGKATGNKSLATKGSAQKAKGTVKDKVGKATRKVTRGK